MIVTSFFPTGGTQSFVVPIGVTTVTVECSGAQGGYWGANTSSGKGGYVKAEVPVTAGETLTVFVGMPGGSSGGGFGGSSGGTPLLQHSGGLGDRPAQGGGGSSEVRRGSTRLVVAGGGGGMGGVRFSTPGFENVPPPIGGYGGIPASAGTQPNSGGGAGGGAATASAGGAAGAAAGGSGAAVATAGSAGSGGNGGGGSAFGHAGGGGGGGLFGGGGGGGGGNNSGLTGSGGGGGGGSSGTGGTAVPLTFISNTSTQGVVRISYNEVPPSIPTNITPAAGAVVNVDNPVLGARFVTTTSQARARVQWQVASDAGFTQNVRTYTQPESMLTQTGPSGVVASYTIGSTTSDQRLSQGTWYIRARTIDANGTASAFSGVQSFRVEFPPSTLNHYPTGNAAVQFVATGVTLAWDFISVAPNTSQSAYQVVVEQNNGTLVVDTGKVASSAPQTIVIIPTSLKGAQLRWRVRVWDTDNVVGPYSTFNLFRTADLPVVAIADITTVNTANPIIRFNVTPAGNAPILQRRLYVTRDSDGAIVYDSGWV